MHTYRVSRFVISSSGSLRHDFIWNSDNAPRKTGMDNISRGDCEQDGIDDMMRLASGGIVVERIATATVTTGPTGRRPHSSDEREESRDDDAESRPPRTQLERRQRRQLQPRTKRGPSRKRASRRSAKSQARAEEEERAKAEETPHRRARAPRAPAGGAARRGREGSQGKSRRREAQARGGGSPQGGRAQAQGRGGEPADRVQGRRRAVRERRGA